MTTKIQIELPDAISQTAQAAGLLTPKMLNRLFSNALCRQQTSNYLLSLADEMATAGIAPMTMEEINAEVKAARREPQHHARASQASIT